jgi:hypothetical protein
LRCQMRWSMYLADFDYSITYICSELNTTTDALSHMPDAATDACLAACAIAYTCNAPTPSIASILNIAANQSLLDTIIAGYETDDFTQQLTKNISMGSIEGATLTDKLLYVRHQLIIPWDLDVCKPLYNLAHDTLGHFGFNKSYESLRGSYYWLNMHCDLENTYIPSCTECQQNRSCTSKPTSPLHPLPVPDDHFNTVALDFIGPLPEEHGKDTILTMTDPLRANIHITATHSTYTAAQVAVVLFDKWYCENGLMLHLISNRDLLFTTNLWTTLFH